MRKRIVGLSCALLVACSGSCYTQQPGDKLNSEQKPPLLQQLTERTDDLRFEKLLERSTVEAESFRRSLLQDEKRSAKILSVACVSFRDLPEVRKLSESAEYSLSQFELDEQQIANAIEGTRPLSNPAELYGSFEGKWYGLWEKNKVDHHWGKFVSLDNPTTFEISDGQPVRLMGYQYAWVGDGYGINHVVRSADGEQTFLLGYVVHVRDEDPEKEFLRRPHVGVIDGPGRLIWITESEVFFEELVKGENPENDRYYITGFRYSIKDNMLSASQAFQAVYSRDAGNRKPWRGFKVELTVGSQRSQKPSK